jgi:hypothetical protein
LRLLGEIVRQSAGFLAFRSTGSIQFGYRFSLDFMPFLFMLIMRRGFTSGRVLPVGFKAIVVAASISDLYLFWTFIDELGKRA